MTTRITIIGLVSLFVFGALLVLGSYKDCARDCFSRASLDPGDDICQACEFARRLGEDVERGER